MFPRELSNSKPNKTICHANQFIVVTKTTLYPPICSIFRKNESNEKAAAAAAATLKGNLTFQTKFSDKISTSIF